MAGLAVCFSGCMTTESTLNLVPTTIQIKSEPSGALVMMSFDKVLNEKTAPILGTTPLMRRKDVPASGASLRISKPGYREWNGSISAGNSKIRAELVPFSPVEKEQLQWTEMRGYHQLNILPVQIKVRKIGDSSYANETSQLTSAFRSRCMKALTDITKNRFGEIVRIQKVEQLEDPELWESLNNKLDEIRVEKIGFYPIPPRVELSPEFDRPLSDLGGAVLLVRAEAYYLGKLKRFKKTAIPLALTFASALLMEGTTVGSSGTSDYYIYPVFGPEPEKELVFIQLYLVDSESKELLWFGQSQIPTHFDREGVVDNLAETSVGQLPSAFFRQN